MNTFKTPTTTIRTVMLSLITLGLCGGTAAVADQVGFSTRTKTVSFDDLNLSTMDGQQAAHARVEKLARVLCSQVADPTDLSHHSNFVACVDAAVGKAGANLQVLINQKSGAHFARADSK